jgi:glycosyltransferase involved in cell wall biosynthesis
VKIVSVMTTASLGGAEFAAVELLDALAMRGHDVVMLSDHPDLARGDMGRRTQIRLQPIAIGPKLSARTYGDLVLRAPLLLRRLRESLEAEAPYDVLMLHYKKEQLLGSLLPRRLRAALVWAEWGPVPHPLRRSLPRRVYVAAARKAAAILAVSDGTRRSLVDTGIPPQLLTRVPNAIRPDLIDFTAEGRSRVRKSLGIPEDGFVVGCVSRLHAKKRNDVLVQAVTRLQDERTHLVIAGNGEAEERLRALAAPLNGRAHFLPTLRRELPDVLSAFDVAVSCPSPTEGQPRALIMAMLARRAWLSTAAEGATELVRQDCGTIVTPEHDPSALAAQLRIYREDAGRRAREGATARRLAEATFAAPVVGARVDELLREVVGAGR